MMADLLSQNHHIMRLLYRDDGILSSEARLLIVSIVYISANVPVSQSPKTHRVRRLRVCVFMILSSFGEPSLTGPKQ